MAIKIKRKTYTLIIFNDLPVHRNEGKVIKKTLPVKVIINGYRKNI